MHVIHAARRIERGRATVAVPGIYERAVTGRPRQLLRKLPPHGHRAQSIMQHHDIGAAGGGGGGLNETIFDSAAVEVQLVGLHSARNLKR